MSLGELLRTKSSEYELLAEWRAERAPLDGEHFVACQAMAVVGIVLREVAEAVELEWGEEAEADALNRSPPSPWAMEFPGFRLTPQRETATAVWGSF
jgi:hypothetical protein